MCKSHKKSSRPWTVERLSQDCWYTSQNRVWYVYEIQRPIHDHTQLSSTWTFKRVSQRGRLARLASLSRWQFRPTLGKCHRMRSQNCRGQFMNYEVRCPAAPFENTAFATLDECWSLCLDLSEEYGYAEVIFRALNGNQVPMGSYKNGAWPRFLMRGPAAFFPADHGQSTKCHRAHNMPVLLWDNNYRSAQTQDESYAYLYPTILALNLCSPSNLDPILYT